MSDKGAGKWLPYDLNGSVHECKTQTTSTSTGTKKVETKPQEPSEVIVVLEEAVELLKTCRKLLVDQKK